jgi:hypothetical protein
MLARLKAEHATPWQLILKGIPPHYIHRIAKTDGLRADYGISAHRIVEAVETAVV